MTLLLLLLPLAAPAHAAGGEAIPWQGGILVTTSHRTIARWQHALPGERDFAILLRDGRAAAMAKKPNEWRVLFAIVRAIDAEWKDAAGAAKRTRTSISDAEAARCKTWFAEYKDMVVAYTGGAMRIVEDSIEVAGPVDRVDEMGGGKYWLSPGTALRGVAIAEDKYDSVIVHYRPGDIPMGLFGGALGKDAGLAGSAVLSLALGEDIWASKDRGSFDLAGCATFHEWLHHMSYCAREVMGYRTLPDCHSAEEYGFNKTDGGYVEWFAWYRALTRSLYPEAFWRTADMTLPLRAPGAPTINADVEPGKLYAWRDVREDWPRRLPRLDEAFFRERTGLSGLTLSLEQARANDAVRLVVGGFAPKEVLSRVAAPGPGPREGEVALDNVLGLARAAHDPPLGDPLGGWGDRPIESLALVRYRPPAGSAPKHRDLLFLRFDAIEPVLAFLAKRKVDAAKQVLGFVALPDPAEREPVVFFVVETDLGGAKPPADELAAVGLRR